MAKEGSIEVWSDLFAWFYSVFNRNPPSNRVIVENAAPGPGDRILDIGCGPGASLEYAHQAGAETFGVDPSPGMVRRAARRVPEATVVQGSAEHLEFPDDQFNLVWSVASYHHWAYPDTAFKEIKRVLAPGGRVLVMERHLKEGKTGHGLSRAEADALAEELDGYGFSDTTFDTVKAGRHQFLIVTAVA